MGDSNVPVIVVQQDSGSMSATVIAALPVLIAVAVSYRFIGWFCNTHTHAKKGHVFGPHEDYWSPLGQCLYQTKVPNR